MGDLGQRGVGFRNGADQTVKAMGHPAFAVSCGFSRRPEAASGRQVGPLSSGLMRNGLITRRCRAPGSAASTFSVGLLVLWLLLVAALAASEGGCCDAGKDEHERYLDGGEGFAAGEGESSG